MKRFIDIAPEVQVALDTGGPVVALESTIIAHGMPFPTNIETALSVQETIRLQGAVPATIGILDGRIKVGMTEEEIYRLAKAEHVVKVSRRDFPFVVANKLDGATTVAGTMIAAEMAGIRIFVTGGIGGVHRNAAETFDISADLEELKRTDVVVVCAGVKSVLDIGATLEYLETAGVPVITVGSDRFPAFYSRESGFPAECRLDDISAIADLITAKYEMGLSGGMVIACPIPEEFEIPADQIDATIQRALDAGKAASITGKRVTPFLLDQIKQLTEGKSLEANIKLVQNNSAIGGMIAAKLSESVV